MWPRVAGVLILLVGAGGAWLWQNPGFIQTSVRPLLPGFARHDTQAASIKALEARVVRLEQAPPPADLAPFTARLDALEKRLPPPGPPAGQSVAQSAGQPETQPSSRPSVDLGPLLARLDALEARPAAMTPQPAETSIGPVMSPTAAAQAPPVQVSAGPDLRPLLARLDTLERQQAAPTIDPARVDALASRVDALSAHDPAAKVDALASRIDAVAARDPAAEVRGKLDDVEHRLSELTSDQTKLADSSGRTARLARLGAAEIALASGRPLGSIPDAPPALAQFATTVPPTEAGLRLAFPAASQAAVKVSLPDTEGKPFLDRVMTRLRDSRLITVKEGDHVVIGNPAAETLAQAQVLLDAGDLSGAVRAVATLSGPPVEKMAPWLADARALQAAREALASLAESG